MLSVPFKVVELIVGEPPVGKRYQVQFDNGHVTPTSETTYKLFQAYREAITLNQELTMAVVELKKSKENPQTS